MIRRDDLPHLRLPPDRTRTLPYLRPGGGRGRYQVAPRDRRAHADHLLDQLRAIKAAEADRRRQRQAAGVPQDLPGLIEITGEVACDLAIRELTPADGPELLSARMVEGAPMAVVRASVQELQDLAGKVEKFKRVDRMSRDGTLKPVYDTLVRSISHLRVATLASVWASRAPLPGAICWCEVWLRGGDPEARQLRDLASRIRLRVDSRMLRFADRDVLLVHGTTDHLETCIRLLDGVAEIRPARTLASFFTDMPGHEQGEWVSTFARDIAAPRPDAPAVCLLDTGVNRGHPLLDPVLAVEDMHAVDREWGTADSVVGWDRGHGTRMAGLAAWGDLTEALGLAPAPAHRLESVKLLPPTGRNRPELYGDHTRAAVARAELGAPFRSRVVCLAVTTDDSDRGADSSWSAAIDLMCHGREDEQPRLFVISTGNVS